MFDEIRTDISTNDIMWRKKKTKLLPELYIAFLRVDMNNDNELNKFKKILYHLKIININLYRDVH